MNKSIYGLAERDYFSVSLGIDKRQGVMYYNNQNK